MIPVSVGDAKSRFSELISRASAGERFVIERRNQPVAALVSADDLARLERHAEWALRLAESLGQSKEILDGIRAGKLHPVMAAYGLLKEDDVPAFEEAMRRGKIKSKRNRVRL